MNVEEVRKVDRNINSYFEMLLDTRYVCAKAGN